MFWGWNKVQEHQQFSPSNSPRSRNCGALCQGYVRSHPETISHWGEDGHQKLGVWPQSSKVNPIFRCALKLLREFSPDVYVQQWKESFSYMGVMMLILSGTLPSWKYELYRHCNYISLTENEWQWEFGFLCSVCHRIYTLTLINIVVQLPLSSGLQHFFLCKTKWLGVGGSFNVNCLGRVCIALHEYALIRTYYSI